LRNASPREGSLAARNELTVGLIRVTPLERFGRIRAIGESSANHQ
tara:strand:- start:106270 stop:106404 length:135 start_codon:yes stop_codon:yes gene_type:complete